MWGAIIGDIVGSRFEFHNTNDKDFELFTFDCDFTDDTVLTVAVADSLLCQGDDVSEIPFKKTLIKKLKLYVAEYPKAGYGNSFQKWSVSGSEKPYGSCGNGSAMRVSPVGWYGNTLEEVEKIAKWSAEVTHNHPEGIKGAQCVAGAIFLARTGENKEGIKRYAEEKYGYVFDKTVGALRFGGKRPWDETCQVAIPVSMQCFFEGKDFEDVIRNAVAVGGDSDTFAAIAGSIAEAYYGIPNDLIEIAKQDYTTNGLNKIIDNFYRKIKFNAQYV